MGLDLTNQNTIGKYSIGGFPHFEFDPFTLYFGYKCFCMLIYASWGKGLNSSVGVAPCMGRVL